MGRNGSATRRVTTSIVSAVGLFAGADSYVHIYGLARGWHQNIASAALVPLTADGVVFASTAAMFAATRHERGIPARARAWFWIGTLVTVLGNGASGWAHGTGAALLALWPVVAYIGCMEVLTWMLQHLWGPQAKKPASKLRPAPASNFASIDAPPPPVTPEPEDAPHDELSDRRDQKKTYAPRRSLEVLLAEAQEKFASDLNAGKIPGQRAIATAVNCGPGKADEIRKHLENLQTA